MKRRKSRCNHKDIFFSLLYEILNNTKDLFILENKIQRRTILQQVFLLPHLQKCLERLASKPLLQLEHVDCLDQIQGHSGHSHV
jgi:hypothetical protein